MDFSILKYDDISYNDKLWIIVGLKQLRVKIKYLPTISKDLNNQAMVISDK